MEDIYVTKTYLPERSAYDHLISRIWKERYVTNNGPLSDELHESLKNYLDVPYLQWVNNGTTALQIAINALQLKGSIITTPFTYVATANSIMWERCTPIFVDIHPDTFSIDASKIASKIEKDTVAILGVHVFGYPCDVEAIQDVANTFKLKVIYDASHGFGCKYKGKSLVSYGDMATLSFHATKVYHTIEGGCTISNSAEEDRMLKLSVTHGHEFDNYQSVGINGKNSEFHAAIGILNLEIFDKVVQGRKQIFDLYFEKLHKLNLKILNPAMFDDFEYNYAYFPILFKNEKCVLKAIKNLNKKNIFPRRYFYPSLNTLPYLNKSNCPVSEDISSRILCLPLYHDLDIKYVEQIAVEITNMV